MAKEDKDIDKPKPNIKDLFGKNPVGRPPVYEDYKDMYIRIYDYLEFEDSVSKGKYTIEGCALWLGFSSRQSMYDYDKKSSEFSYILGRFNLFLSHYHAQGLKWVGSFQGSQFWLKNFGGYKDEITQNQNQTVTTVQPSIISGSPKLANDEKEIDV